MLQLYVLTAWMLAIIFQTVAVMLPSVRQLLTALCPLKVPVMSPPLYVSLSLVLLLVNALTQECSAMVASVNHVMRLQTRAVLWNSATLLQEAAWPYPAMLLRQITHLVHALVL